MKISFFFSLPVSQTRRRSMARNHDRFGFPAEVIPIQYRSNQLSANKNKIYTSFSVLFIILEHMYARVSFGLSYF